MDWLTEGSHAAADARRLRERHGAGAEAWCESMLAALPARDPRRRSIRMIRRALRAMPCPRTGLTSAATDKLAAR